MPKQKLAKLERVELRDVWGDEAGDFTPWLASEQNIALLGDVLGLELEVESMEKSVGPFRADILCKDTANERYVLIENQLAKTDHTHLGQLITYAAGLEAVVVVWVAERITEEHRAAIDWLNNVAGDEANFFALEIEAWRIGDSPAAPKFNVVCKPNDWTKSVNPQTELTDTQQLQLEYWTAFKDVLETSNTTVKPTKPQPAHWMTFAVGRSGFYLVATASVRDRRISGYLNIYGSDRLAHFRMLADDREDIEKELGFPVVWEEMADKKESHVRWSREETDPADRSNWTAQHALLRDILDKLHHAFRPRIKNLDAGDYTSEEGK